MLSGGTLAKASWVYRSQSARASSDAEGRQSCSNLIVGVCAGIIILAFTIQVHGWNFVLGPAELIEADRWDNDQIRRGVALESLG